MTVSPLARLFSWLYSARASSSSAAAAARRRQQRKSAGHGGGRESGKRQRQGPQGLPPQLAASLVGTTVDFLSQLEVEKLGQAPPATRSARDVRCRRRQPGALGPHNRSSSGAGASSALFDRFTGLTPICRTPVALSGGLTEMPRLRPSAQALLAALLLLAGALGAAGQPAGPGRGRELRPRVQRLGPAPRPSCRLIAPADPTSPRQAAASGSLAQALQQRMAGAAPSAAAAAPAAGPSAGAAAANSSIVAAGPVLISELMPSNKQTIKDEDGAASDWLELFNRGTAVVSLAVRRRRAGFCRAPARPAPTFMQAGNSEDSAPPCCAVSPLPSAGLQPD